MSAIDPERRIPVNEQVKALVGSVEGAVASFFIDYRDLDPDRKLELIETYKQKIRFDKHGRLLPLLHDCVVPEVLLRALTAVDIKMHDIVREYGEEVIPEKNRVTDVELTELSSRDLTKQIEEE